MSWRMGAVSQAPLQPCRRAPAARCVVCRAAPYRSPPTVPQEPPCRVIARTCGLERHVAVSGPAVSQPSLSRYKTVSRDTSHVACALGRVARAALCVARALGRIVAVSWPYHGPLAARPAQLCHDTICCIVTQHKLKMGNSPFQSPLRKFFFFLISFFFPLFTYWKT